MKVVFLQSIKGVAQTGDIKSVADGYARNFLFPKGIAVTATAETEKLAETLRNKKEADLATRKERGLEMVKKLEGLVLEIKEDANEQGHLYGSVTAKAIAQTLEHERGLNITADLINLEDHIKTVGTHEVEIEFHPEVKTKIKVMVSSA